MSNRLHKSFLDVSEIALGIFARQIDISKPLLFEEQAKASFAAGRVFQDVMHKERPDEQSSIQNILDTYLIEHSATNRNQIINFLRLETSLSDPAIEAIFNNRLKESGLRWCTTTLEWHFLLEDETINSPEVTVTYHGTTDA